MIITVPGFYLSKAGKCEVVAVLFGAAIGWNNLQAPRIWVSASGICVGGFCGYEPNSDADNITSAYVEPRKPVEAYALVAPDGKCLKLGSTTGEALDYGRPIPFEARLVHLREVEDSNDNR